MIDEIVIAIVSGVVVGLVLKALGDDAPAGRAQIILLIGVFYAICFAIGYGAKTLFRWIW